MTKRKREGTLCRWDGFELHYRVTQILDNEKDAWECLELLKRDNVPIVVREIDGKFAGYRTDGYTPSKREDGVQYCGKVLSYGSIAGTRGRKSND